MALIEKLTAIGNAIRGKTGKSGTLTLEQMVTEINGIQPGGEVKVVTGTYTLSKSVAGGSTFTVDHNAGFVPDLFYFYAPANIASTSTMICVFYSPTFLWRSTGYKSISGYHSTSTTTVTFTNNSSSYGVKSITDTQAVITTYSSSTSYFWYAGTYNWVAVKF